MSGQQKFTKLHFIGLFLLIVGVLFTIRCVNPKIANPYLYAENDNVSLTDSSETTDLADDLELAEGSDSDLTALEPSLPYDAEVAESLNTDTTEITVAPIVATIPKTRIESQSRKVDSLFLRKRNDLLLVDNMGKRVRNKIKSVKSYRQSFHDLNDVQLATAQAIGIDKIEDRAAAARKMDGLVYVGDNPYYGVKPLTHSIAYLVPRAAICLEEIARAFIDSCATKGVPMHKIMLTSVLRTEKDVKRLRRVNLNASENSCHQYGTTFDISYNHFIPIEKRNASPTSSIKLKQILAEVLEDQHRMGTCYIKYEHLRSACFHITAR